MGARAQVQPQNQSVAGEGAPGPSLEVVQACLDKGLGMPCRFGSSRGVVTGICGVLPFRRGLEGSPEASGGAGGQMPWLFQPLICSDSDLPLPLWSIPGPGGGG